MEQFLPHFIYIFLPISGLLLFGLIVLRMYNQQIENKPITELFTAFLSYGILLILVLTIVYELWSGLAIIGVFYSLIIAPIIHLVICIYFRKETHQSHFHKWIYKSLIFYFFIAPSILYLLFLKN